MKRLFAMFLALCMALSLAACGGDKEPTSTKDPSAPAGTVGANTGYQGELPLVKEGEKAKITIGVVAHNRVSDYEDNAYTKWLEEQTGIDIEVQVFSGTQSEAATQFALMAAGNDKLPDILFRFSGIKKPEAQQYGRDGYFLDLTEYMEKYSYYWNESLDTVLADDPSVKDVMLQLAKDPVSGGMYWLPTMEDVPLDTPKCHTWINTAWLDAVGMEAPNTIDELYDVLVAFRDQDPNGNGKKDEIPMIGRTNIYRDIVHWLLNAFTFTDDTYRYSVDANGVVTGQADSGEYRQALIFINKLVNEGLLSPLTWTQSAAELKALINPEDNVYTCGIITGHADVEFEVGGDSIFAYEPLKPLADATGKGGYGPRTYYTLNNSTFITESCQNPELAFKLLDFMCSQESALRQRWGEFGVDWTWTDEGTTGNLGGQAKLKILNSTQFSTDNNRSWHLVNTISSERYWEYETDFSNTEDWDTVRVLKLVEGFDNYLEAGMPKNYIVPLAYTEEEDDLVTEYDADLASYISQCRADFSNGVTDPNDDAAWKTYLDGLEALHYSDLVQVAQSAYTRSVS